MDKNRLRKIYDRTNGYCHICRKKLSLTNYGKFGLKGAWHIEHSNPRVKGGTDHGNNLYAACIKCNIDKGVKTTRTARRKHGYTSAPLNKVRMQKSKTGNTVAGAIIGGTLGLFGGPLGVAVGSTVGGIIGNNISNE